MIKEKKLSQCLDLLDKEQIESLYIEATHFLKEKTNSKTTIQNKKKIIIEKIESLFPIINLTLTQEEEKQLKSLIEGKKINKISSKLLNNLYVFEDNQNEENSYIVPYEIANLFKIISSPKMKKEKELMVISYYLEVNGVIHIDKLLELSKHTGISLTKTKLIKYINEDNYLFENELVYLNEIPKKLDIQKQKQKNVYKIYSLEEIVFNNFNNLKKENEEKLSKILYKYSDNTDELFNYIMDAINIGYNNIEIVDNILEEIKIKNNKDFEKINYLIEKIYLSTPSWELNGFTPQELLDFYEEENDEEEEISEYVYAYIMINGAIKIDTILKLLTEENHFNLTKKQLIQIIKDYDDVNILGQYVVIKGMPKDILKYLMSLKNKNDNYKIIDDLEEIFKEEDQNFYKICEIGNEFNFSEIVISNLVNAMHFGNFSEEILDAIINTHGITLENNKKIKLYKKLTTVNKNIRLWNLNGYKKNEKIIQKIPV